MSLLIYSNLILNGFIVQVSCGFLFGVSALAQTAKAISTTPGPNKI